MNKKLFPILLSLPVLLISCGTIEHGKDQPASHFANDKYSFRAFQVETLETKIDDDLAKYVDYNVVLKGDNYINEVVTQEERRDFSESYFKDKSIHAPFDSDTLYSKTYRETFYQDSAKPSERVTIFDEDEYVNKRHNNQFLETTDKLRTYYNVSDDLTKVRSRTFSYNEDSNGVLIEDSSDVNYDEAARESYFETSSKALLYDGTYTYDDLAQVSGVNKDGDLVFYHYFMKDAKEMELRGNYKVYVVKEGMREFRISFTKDESEQIVPYLSYYRYYEQTKALSEPYFDKARINYLEKPIKFNFEEVVTSCKVNKLDLFDVSTIGA